MTRPVLIIANPVSGGGKGEELANQLALELERRGTPTTTQLTSLERSGRAIGRDVEPGEFSAIVVVGGDGSMHDVLAELGDPAAPVGLLPAGTANVLAAEVGISRRPANVADVVLAGRTIEAARPTVNGEPFFLFVGAGIDARIVRRVEGRRKRKGHLGGMSQWVVPAWAEFGQRPLADLSVSVDGRLLEGLAQVLVTRVRSYAGMMRMPAGIDIQDGALHVLSFPRKAKPRYLATAGRAVLGRMKPGAEVSHIVTRGPVRIESHAGEEPFHCDGSDAGTLPAEITLVGDTVRLLVP